MVQGLPNGLRYRQGGLARRSAIMVRNLENCAGFSGRVNPIRVHTLLGVF